MIPQPYQYLHCSLFRELRNPDKSLLDSDPRDYVIINVYHFKLQRFGVISYSARGNEYNICLGPFTCSNKTVTTDWVSNKKRNLFLIFLRLEG